MRASSRSATSSTRSCSARNASWSPAAWLTRSSRPDAPSTACCAARSRRSRTATTLASTSAMRATRPAASAAMPAGSVSWSTPGRLALREQGLVLRGVVVLLLLARHRLDLHGDGHRRVERRRGVEAERGRDRRAGGDGLDRPLHADRLRAALDPQHDVDVALVVLALVGEGDRELGVLAVGDAVRRVGLEREVADGDRVDAGAV